MEVGKELPNNFSTFKYCQPKYLSTSDSQMNRAAYVTEIRWSTITALKTAVEADKGDSYWWALEV
ncbi:hypothetical protein Dda_9308 [Drechslerella dactyloides]|uniref:Uncharacterized protein n=1 Tax=Drechslerella dactyloides TaxID=74499 RepID=A0AAD6NFB8_DREDA|nr:hypothetical protein Dda_9308 [Drechslerella dactyloides]